MHLILYGIRNEQSYVNKWIVSTLLANYDEED